MLSEKTGLNIPDDEGYESLGGFIFDQLGHIPVENEKVEWDNVEFIVEKIDKQRIKRVKVILPEEESGKETKEK